MTDRCKGQAEQYANDLLTFYGKPEHERWQGFTAVIATYGGTNDLAPNTALAREAAKKMFNQFAEEKPPATINGVQFVLRSVRLVEETPTTGFVEAEYVRLD